MLVVHVASFRSVASVEFELLFVGPTNFTSIHSCAVVQLSVGQVVGLLMFKFQFAAPPGTQPIALRSAREGNHHLLKSDCNFEWAWYFHARSMDRGGGRY